MDEDILASGLRGAGASKAVFLFAAAAYPGDYLGVIATLSQALARAIVAQAREYGAGLDDPRVAETLAISGMSTRMAVDIMLAKEDPDA